MNKKEIREEYLLHKMVITIAFTTFLFLTVYLIWKESYRDMFFAMWMSILMFIFLVFNEVEFINKKNGKTK